MHIPDQIQQERQREFSAAVDKLLRQYDIYITINEQINEFIQTRIKLYCSYEEPHVKWVVFDCGLPTQRIIAKWNDKPKYKSGKMIYEDNWFDIDDPNNSELEMFG